MGDSLFLLAVDYFNWWLTLIKTFLRKLNSQSSNSYFKIFWFYLIKRLPELSHHTTFGFVFTVSHREMVVKSSLLLVFLPTFLDSLGMQLRRTYSLIGPFRRKHLGMLISILSYVLLSEGEGILCWAISLEFWNGI